jgi:hypothetical protein
LSIPRKSVSMPDAHRPKSPPLGHVWLAVSFGEAFNQRLSALAAQPFALRAAGPLTWLIVGDDRGPFAEVEPALASEGALIDLSHGRARYEIEGAGARETRNRHRGRSRTFSFSRGRGLRDYVQSYRRPSHAHGPRSIRTPPRAQLRRKPVAGVDGMNGRGPAPSLRFDARRKADFARRKARLDPPLRRI